MTREELKKALAKPTLTDTSYSGCEDYFDPWNDIISDVFGHYAKESDDKMIECLEAIRDRTTFKLIEKEFSYELMLYVLAGKGLIDYGTSPRGGWFVHADLLQTLIDKWKQYSIVVWSE